MHFRSIISFNQDVTELSAITSFRTEEGTLAKANLALFGTKRMVGLLKEQISREGKTVVPTSGEIALSWAE